MSRSTSSDSCRESKEEYIISAFLNFIIIIIIISSYYRYHYYHCKICKENVSNFTVQFSVSICSLKIWHYVKSQIIHSWSCVFDRSEGRRLDVFNDRLNFAPLSIFMFPPPAVLCLQAWERKLYAVSRNPKKALILTSPLFGQIGRRNHFFYQLNETKG